MNDIVFFVPGGEDLLAMRTPSPVIPTSPPRDAVPPIRPPLQPIQPLLNMRRGFVKLATAYKKHNDAFKAPSSHAKSSTLKPIGAVRHYRRLHLSFDPTMTFSSLLLQCHVACNRRASPSIPRYMVVPPRPRCISRPSTRSPSPLGLSWEVC